MIEVAFVRAKRIVPALSLALLSALVMPDFVMASPLLPTRMLANDVPSLAETVQHRRGGAARRGFVAKGPHGGTVAGRRAVTVRPSYRPGYRPVRPLPRPVVVAPGWRRPAGYWWRPGGALTAGAALGFVTAAAATAYAGQPPAPGQCWYSTNPQRTQGFWDICPR